MFYVITCTSVIQGEQIACALTNNVPAAVYLLDLVKDVCFELIRHLLENDAAYSRCTIYWSDFETYYLPFFFSIPAKRRDC